MKVFLGLPYARPKAVRLTGALQTLSESRRQIFKLEKKVRRNKIATKSTANVFLKVKTLFESIIFKDFSKPSIDF